MNLYYYDTLLGRTGIAENGGAITNLFFGNGCTTSQAKVHETAVLMEAARQLNEYLSGRRKEFSLPLAPSGTPFMESVWQALCAIPYGKTASYRDIAAAVGRPKAARAVGMANNRNPLPVFIPCHRVIGADGSLVGYGGGIDKKILLLEIERQNS